jgi:tetratricopeptide (TPR) repeat protein
VLQSRTGSPENDVRRISELCVLLFAAALLAGCAGRIDVGASRQQAILAKKLEREGKIAEAESCYKEALRANRFNETAYHGLARIYLDRGDSHKALRLLDRAVAYAGKTGPADIPAKAAALIVTDRPQEASWILEGALDNDPARADLRLLLAAACFKSKQFARAAREIQSVPLEPAAGSAESPAERAAADIGLDAQSLKRFLWEVWSNYLRSLERDQWSEEAEDTAARAERYFPKAAHFKAYRARLRYLHGEREQALELMARALEMDPFDMEVVREARNIYVCERRYADALAVWRRAIPRSFVFAPDNLLKGRLEALESFTQRASEKKDDAEAQYLLAMAYRHMGWIEEAIAQIKIALGIDAGNQDAAREMLLLDKHERYLARIKTFLGYLYDAELRDGAAPSVGEVVASLRSMAQAEGIVLADSPHEVYTLPLYGSEIHAFNRENSALAAYFLEFGEYLQVSRIYEPPFCQIMNVIAWFENTRGIDSQCVVCDEDRVRSLAGYAFNRSIIGGHSTLSRKGFYVDFDGLRPDMQFVQAAKAALKEPGGKPGQSGLYSDEGRNAVLARILSGADVSSDDVVFQRLSEVMLDNVAYHELGHVKDLQRFIPIYAHIPAHLLEGFRAGLRPSMIRDRMELRAEAYSLAHSPEPHGVILNNLLRLQADAAKPRYIDYLLYSMPMQEADYSPYISGAGRILEFSREYLEKESGAKVSPADTALRLSRMTARELSQIGEALLGDQGMR